MTRREQLIQQLRSALNLLERPGEEEVVFEVADTEFDFTAEDLETQIRNC